MTETQLAAIRGARDALRESAKQHRAQRDVAHANVCNVQADTLATVLADDVAETLAAEVNR